MTSFQALVLGLVQGATEFLPVSSSGHLVLLPAFAGWPTAPLSFDVALHVGTTAAVIVFYARDLAGIVRGAALWLISAVRRREVREDDLASARLAGWLVLGSVPAALAGVGLKSWFESAFEKPPSVAVALLVTGAILLLAHRCATGRREMKTLTWRDALLIGCAQAVAIFPGISRSGSTIAAGLSRGLSRRSAPRFAFLLSVPAVLGAAVLQAKDLCENAVPAAAAVVPGVTANIVPQGVAIAGPMQYAVGVFVAFVSGLIAIKLVLIVVERAKLTWFALYCWAVGLGSLVWLATGPSL